MTFPGASRHRLSHCNPGAKHRTPLTERISRGCNRRMNPRRSDDELWSVLDDPGLWLVYGGGVLAEETTLREALHRAHDLSARGSPLSEVVRTTDSGIEIPSAQIQRLWKRLGLEG
jgi:hypothetical protein